MNAVCIAPNEIQEGDLLAYLDGAAPPGVAAHLARCAFCAAEAAGLAALDATLLAAHVRVACPAPDELLRYQAGLLSRAARRRLKQHLTTCAACQADLARLALPLLARAPVSVVERLRQAGATIMAALQPPALQPALAVRGEEAPLRQFSAAPYQVQLRVIAPALAGESWRVEGQLSLSSGDLLPPAARQADLALADVLSSSDRIDDFGFFAFDNVLPGAYFLHLTLPDANLLIESFEVP